MSGGVRRGTAATTGHRHGSELGVVSGSCFVAPHWFTPLSFSKGVGWVFVAPQALDFSGEQHQAFPPQHHTWQNQKAGVQNAKSMCG